MAGQYLYTPDDWARHQLLAMGRNHYRIMVEKVLSGDITVPEEYCDAMLEHYNAVLEVDSGNG